MNDSPQRSFFERFIDPALWFERYVQPLLYFWLLWPLLTTIYTRVAVVYRILSTPGMSGSSWPIFLTALTRDVLLAWVFVFYGVTLLFSRRPAHKPRNLAHLLVPLAMTYYFLLYRLLEKLPEAWTGNRFPVEWRIVVTSLAVILALTGYAIALWGLSYLRGSFAIFVAVRKVVTDGPYAYIRHPMYTGYIFEMAGLVLSAGSPAMLVLALGFLTLMAVRARMEEVRLCEASPDYRAYMQHTGRFFPKLLSSG